MSGRRWIARWAAVAGLAVAGVVAYIGSVESSRYGERLSFVLSACKFGPFDRSDPDRPKPLVTVEKLAQAESDGDEFWRGALADSKVGDVPYWDLPDSALPPGEAEKIKAACDPESSQFVYADEPTKKIRAVYEEAEFWRYTMSWLAPVGIIVVFSIPWLWYFLLARVRELGDSIRGKPD